MIYKRALICKTKNLFSTSTEVGILSGFSNTTPRQFEEGKWYIGLTGHNYYLPGNIVEYELTENSIYVNTKGNGYGITRAFKCESDTHYVVSWIYGDNTTDKNKAYVQIGYYDVGGNWIKSTDSAVNATQRGFTTPANCKWFAVDFTSLTPNSLYVSNLQLEKGPTATNYVPYGYLQSYKKAIKVSDICQLLDKSKFPATHTDQGVTFTNNGDGTVTVNGTSTSTYYSAYHIPIDMKHCIPLHKYAILSTGLKEDAGSTSYTSQTIIANFPDNHYIYCDPNAIYEIPDHEGYYNFRWDIRVNKGITVTNLVCKPQLFDLTEMYGAGNEPKTVAEFRQKFPNDLYPYRPYCFVDSYKSTVICKTKNLFDISKVQNSTGIKVNGNDINVSIYGASTGLLKDICPSIKAGDTVTISFKLKSYTSEITKPNFLQVQNTIRNFSNLTFTVTEEGLNQPLYLYKSNYYQKDKDCQAVYTDFQIEIGTTATSYVPYGHL